MLAAILVYGGDTGIEEKRIFIYDHLRTTAAPEAGGVWWSSLKPLQYPETEPEILRRPGPRPHC